MNEFTLLFIKSVIIGAFFGLVVVVIGSRINERIYKKARDEERAARAKRQAHLLAETERERESWEQAEVDAKKAERWDLIRRFCPELEPLMKALTAGELKRAISLPEAEKVRERMLGQDLKNQIATSLDPSGHLMSGFHAELNRLRVSGDDEELRLYGHSVDCEYAFQAWLEELAMAATPSVQFAQIAEALEAKRVQRLDRESWALVDVFCPLLKPHMDAPTIGEVKRAMGLPEAREFRSWLRANVEVGREIKRHIEDEEKLRVGLEEVRSEVDEAPLPSDPFSERRRRWEMVFHQWLQELAAAIDGQAQANRTDQGGN